MCVIYRFAKGQERDTSDPSHIVTVTPNTFYKLPYEDGKKTYYYVVTATDRIHNESGVSKKRINL